MATPFDPNEMRRQAVWSALMNAGARMMASAGPSFKPHNTLGSVGQGFAGFGQDVQGSIGAQSQQAMLAAKMAELQRQAGQRETFQKYLAGGSQQTPAQAAQGSVPGLGAIGADVPPGGVSGASGAPDPLREQAAKIAKILGPEAAQKWYMSRVGKRPEGLPVGTTMDANGNVVSMPGAEDIIRGRKRAGASNVYNTLGFKPLTELGKLQSDYESLSKRFGPDHPATRAAKQKIDTYGLSPKTKGELEKTVVDARAGLERIKGIAKQFDPSYQTFPGRALNWTRAMREKLGAELPPDQKQALTKFTVFQRETIQNLNLYIRAITGAQLSEHEAGRIMRGMPNLDDSPTQFKAKLDSTIRELDAAVSRASGQRRGTLSAPMAGTRKKKTILKFDAEGNPVP